MLLIFRIFSILLIFVFVLCIGIGLTSKAESQFTHTYVVNSPPSVVWQMITDDENIPQWMRDVRAVSGPAQLRKDAVYRFYLHRYDRRAYHEEKIDVYKPETRISFLRITPEKRPMLQDVLRLFELRPLRDGTTEITLKLSYRANSFLTRVYDKLYLREQMKSGMLADLRRLKDLIENV